MTYSIFHNRKALSNPRKRIGFEVTGHYGMNLKEFLEDKNLSYMKINQILIKEFSINACEND